MQTTQTAGRVDSPYVVEVIRMHEAIADWTTGTAANTNESYARFARALAPGFVIINPDGVSEDRETVVTRFRALHGSRAGRDFRIEIHEAAVRRETMDTALVTYHELWFEGPQARSTIVATALLQAAPATPRALAWHHLHESWLRPPVSP